MSHRLINSLKRDHVNHRRLLDIFARQIDRVAKVQAPDYDIVEGVIEYFTTYSLRVHHPKEEMLIAAIAARDPAAAEALTGLIAEHHDFHQRIEAFGAQVRGVLGEGTVMMERDAFTEMAYDFIDRERRHMSFEDMHLFPAARRHLTAEDWRELEDQIAAEPDFGRRATRHYAILRREILNWEKRNLDGDAAP
ncbi:MAG: hemerythrin domain-containing protein [Pseudomonadota bacterium]|nr:hemerythrin domain-containing protein [Pseudomonadota bacterium]